jgi:hypothetical protein
MLNSNQPKSLIRKTSAENFPVVSEFMSTSRQGGLMNGLQLRPAPLSLAANAAQQLAEEELEDAEEDDDAPLKEDDSEHAKESKQDKVVHEDGAVLADHQFGPITDVAAIGVCSELDHAREGCDMHIDDKIASAAIGDLTRSRNKTIINAFLEGVKLAEACAGLNE